MSAYDSWLLEGSEGDAIPEPIEEEPTLCWVPITRLHPDAVRYCTAVEQHGRECQGGVEVRR